MFASSAFLPFLCAQSSGVLTIAPPARVLAKRNTVVEAKITAQLRDGYHVNSHTPSEDYLIPLRLTWDSKPLEVAGTVYPKPVMEKYEFSPKPISVFTGDFDIITRFKVPANATSGLGIAVGKLRYQACNEKACLPPRTAEVRLAYEIR